MPNWLYASKEPASLFGKNKSEIELAFLKLNINLEFSCSAFQNALRGPTTQGGNSGIAKSCSSLGEAEIR